MSITIGGYRGIRRAFRSDARQLAGWYCISVKADTHPDYPVVTISCACGSSFESRSTKGDYSVEVCSECHPFYTGTQKLIDVGGRVERFNKRRAKQASS